MISTLTNLSWLTLLANNTIVIMFHAQASFNIKLQWAKYIFIISIKNSNIINLITELNSSNYYSQDILITSEQRNTIRRIMYVVSTSIVDLMVNHFISRYNRSLIHNHQFHLMRLETTTNFVFVIECTPDKYINS